MYNYNTVEVVVAATNLMLAMKILTSLLLNDHPAAISFFTSAVPRVG